MVDLNVPHSILFLFWKYMKYIYIWINDFLWRKWQDSSKQPMGGAWQTWPEHAGLSAAVQVLRLFQIQMPLLVFRVRGYQPFLGGGNSIIFCFHPLFGEDSPFWRIFCSNGLVSNHQLLVVNFHASQLFLPGALPPLRTSCFVNMGEENPSASMALHIPRLSSPPNRFFLQFLNYIVWLHLPPRFSSPLPRNKLLASKAEVLTSKSLPSPWMRLDGEGRHWKCPSTPMKNMFW